MPPYRGLIFDLDDTLIHTGLDYEAMRRSMRRLCEEHLPPERLPENPEHLASAQWVELAAAWDRQQGTQVAVRLLRAVASFERQAMEAFRPAPLAADTVRRLAAQGLLLAVVTNNSRENLLLALRRLGLREILQPAVSRDDAARLKPAPDGLQQVLAAWQNHRGKVGAVAFVGDSPLDAQAASQAGIPFIFYRGGAARRHSQVTVPAGTAHIIDGLPELQGLTAPRSVPEG